MFWLKTNLELLKRFTSCLTRENGMCIHTWLWGLILDTPTDYGDETINHFTFLTIVFWKKMLMPLDACLSPIITIAVGKRQHAFDRFGAIRPLPIHAYVHILWRDALLKLWSCPVPLAKFEATSPKVGRLSFSNRVANYN